MPPFLVHALALCFAALMLTAAFRDVVSFTIPNWISLAVAALVPVAALVEWLSVTYGGLRSSAPWIIMVGVVGWSSLNSGERSIASARFLGSVNGPPLISSWKWCSHE